MSTDFNAVATEFCNFYYNQFDSDRTQLGNLYRPESMLTFETSQLQGARDIVEKLSSLPFQKVAHRVSTLDAQPASPNGDILVMVTGELLIDEEQNAQRYSQVFHLIPDGGSYYVFNDIFRLNYS
ncbi:NTF2 [Candida margitis]|uniref:Nuclear transport factor 2 n=2 Tax=Candida TaxID=5475 RepID=A0AAD5G0Y3_9ASCO|nr:Ntf2 nuclear envelope protein [Candida orthopsilosis Co 90-125]XP_051611130.1 NTF2 [Candida theae]XP_051672713.1 NTF2 [Candida margitis]KAI5967471.1 NTF2 [Candida theae]KAI5969287.1 NTF2 [Candida margitis]CCG20938.1 Ntf2 nuclear envelope protein [Candida orthopsilosis Co 90-125]